MATKNSKPAPTRRRGGWLNPLALLLLVLAVAWGVGAYFTVSDRNLPKIGEIPGLFALGGWNWAIAVVLLVVATVVADRTRPAPDPNAPVKIGGNRWAAPAMLISGGIGLLWIVVFYVTGDQVDIPVYSDLGNWNIVIGMGFIVAAFGFATKWE